MGKVMPVTVNAALGTFACEIVTLEPPELVSVAGRVWEFPTCTLPKLKLAGLAVRDPGVAPVPDSGTLTVGSEASLRIETLPLTCPLD